MEPFPYHRIVVIGATSSGKSNLAERLACKLGLDFVELDALHWEPNWQEAPLEVFRRRVHTALRSGVWVVAGNYHIVRDLIWPRAEAIVWLDYPFWTIFRQLTRRTLRRWRTRELLWGTNRETLWTHLKLWSDDSLYRWLVKTYWRRKREYPRLFSLPEYSHIKVFRFELPKQTETWLNSLKSAPPAKPGNDLHDSQRGDHDQQQGPVEVELQLQQHGHAGQQQSEGGQEEDAA